MRYYKQFHNWPYVHLVALLFGCVCLSVAIVWGDFSAKVSMLACGVFALIAAGVLWKGRRHYLEINQDWIVHHGFQKWQLKKTDLQRVETGQKGWTEDYDPYLKIYTQNRQYHVDNGFLINEQQVEELAKVIRGTPF